MAYTILLIDDDRDFLAEFGKMLADTYNVVPAGDGPTALSLLKKPNEIDLAIIDQRLGGDKGTDVIKALKRLKPELVVILLTGYGSKEAAIDALHARADEYLEKPAHPARVRQLIAEMLANKVRSQDGDIIARAKAIIEKNFDKKLTLANCASLLCLSPKYLSRIFKQQAGIGFNSYKNKIRLQAAREMLAGQQLTVDQISHALGFQHVESFLRVFRKNLRTTPTSYRRKFAPAKRPAN